MTLSRSVRNAAGVLLCLSIWSPPLEAVAEDDIADLKRAIQQLQQQNRELTRRLNVLEGERAKEKQAAQPAPAPKPTQPPQPPRPAPPPPPVAEKAPPSAPPPIAGIAPPSAPPPASLEERVTQLEQSKAAQESATRSIIQGALSSIGPRINEFVSLGGSLEVTAGRSSDFSGTTSDQIQVSTAELDFEMRANEWMVGNMTLAFENGTNALFPTTTAFNPSGTDRFTLDKGYITIGDVMKFPLYVRAGQDYLPFGLSTGVHRNDVLSIVNPLTIEAFEIRKPLVGIGFAFPTPKPAPPQTAQGIPPVRPLVISPLVSAGARALGYKPPPVRPKIPTVYTFPVEPPPFFGVINLYDSSAPDVPNRRVTGNINARLGYRTASHCGRPYEELRSSFVCPWGLEITVDYVSSIFDSRFLQFEYSPFLGQIGQVPGMAGIVKLNFGPFLLIGEWDGALRAARFVDGGGNNVSITPTAWEVALAYQFDWNPWVETIGAQGDYIAIGYSRSSGLAGVVAPAGTTPTRVGFLPQSRLTVTVGEWFLENARLALEYSHNWDYPVSRGGTGNQADGVFLALTYNF